MPDKTLRFDWQEENKNSRDSFLAWMLNAFSNGKTARRLLLHIIIDQDTELMQELNKGRLGEMNKILISLMRELKPKRNIAPLSFIIYSIIALNDEFVTYSGIVTPDAPKFIGGKKSLRTIENIILSW